MLKTVMIKNLKNHIDQEITIKGWVWNTRGSGKIRFVQLRDGSGFVQCVAGVQDVNEETFDLLKHLSQESVIEITGKVANNDRSPIGAEIIVSKCKLINKTNNYPITPKEHGTDFLMDQRHLWLRSPRQQAIMVIRHCIIKAIRDYFDYLEFNLVDAPIFTPNECEGSSTLFTTEYFGEDAYLSQSGQLYMEAASAALGKVYCFGPTFRAENSNTRRHLTEFWMVEPEVAFMDLDGDIVLAEGMLKAIVKSVLENCKTQLALLKRDTSLLEKINEADNFPRVSYDEAVKIIQDNGSDFNYGDDLGAADETIISEKFDLPVIVHRYPKSIKPFYMKVDSENENLVLNMDVLAPEGYGEIIGGSQREENLEVLQKRLKDDGMDSSSLEWFLDLRRYGSVPHAGFGLGIERTVAWICKLPHVRETIPFPRLPKRLRP